MNRETQALLECLEIQRSHVTGILEGLSEEDLRRPLLPSGWSSLGLVQHLAIDVERFWFREVIAGEKGTNLEGSQSAWNVAEELPADQVLNLYRHEIDRSNAVTARVSLDDPPRTWPDYFGEWRLPDVRAILLHVIGETACHAGHLDAARELIDGCTWMTLT
jgi:hypothetical protein